MILRQLIDDIILKATQGSPSDDMDIERSQITYWLDTATSSLKVAEIEKELKDGNQIPQLYITIEECKPLEEEDVACSGDCDDRIFITITGTVLNLTNDAGIVLIRTDDGDEIPLTAIEHVDTLRRLPWAAPSSSNPVAYRVGNKIYVEGYKKSELEFEQLTVWFVERQDLTTLAETAEVKLSDKIKDPVIDTVVDKLKLQLYGSQSDQQNDGVWVPQAQYHNLITKSNQQNA